LQVFRLNEQAFRQFIAERPALNLSALAEELALTESTSIKSSLACAKSPRRNAGIF
jgi:hypothetical protein